MLRKSIGFTIIELVIVVFIIGILAAVALPRFLNLSSNSRTASINAVAGSLSSANTVNYTSRKTSTAYGIAVTNCTSLSGALQGGALPSGYTITSAAVAVDTSVTCTLNGPNSTTATFTATGVN